MSRKLLSGTRNRARIEMLKQILREADVTAVTLGEMGIEQEVEEDGASTEDNARKKALFYFKLTGIPTLSIDGGVHIERFPPEKQPGVLVKRMPGMNASPTDREIMDTYIRALDEVGGESPGIWTASQALVLTRQRVIVQSYTFAVRFTRTARGEIAPGRALDALMIDPQSGKYYTELADEERPYYQKMRAFLLDNLSELPC